MPTLRLTVVRQLAPFLLLATGSLYACGAESGPSKGPQEPQAVTVISAGRGTAQRNLELPGTVHPFEEAVIYPRAGGYLKRWYVDIGDQVKAGQVMAEIDTPDLDQQLAESQQRLAQAEANLKLAGITAERYRGLRSQDAVSAQEVDERSSDLDAKTAIYRAAKADVARLTEVSAFKSVRAPFSGIVGARNLEKTARGALIDAGSRQPDGWLYKINLINPLRVYISVPQAYMTMVRKGTESEIRIREFPGRTFKGTVSRTSQTLDPASRTLLTEVQIPNPKGELYPGLYAEATLRLAESIAPVTLPGSAVLTGSAGARVAVVDDRGRVSIRKVTLGRDLGKVVEILEGVREGERVIASPGDTLADGSMVRVAGGQSGTPPQAGPTTPRVAKQP
jgi:RND family efflux transporter MFP subunit